jgi:hypothetical protein
MTPSHDQNFWDGTQETRGKSTSLHLAIFSNNLINQAAHKKPDVDL